MFTLVTYLFVAVACFAAGSRWDRGDRGSLVDHDENDDDDYGDHNFSSIARAIATPDRLRCQGAAFYGRHGTATPLRGALNSPGGGLP